MALSARARPALDHRTFLYRCFARWGDYADKQKDAVVALVEPAYLAMSYPSRAAFAREQELDPESAACAAGWEALRRECRALLKSAYGDDDLVFAIFARTPDGRALALATMLWITGTRATPIGAAIGDPQSSLPTLRMFRKFRFPAALGLDPDTTPEARVAELARVRVMQKAELDELVGARLVAADVAAYIRAHGFEEAIARTYFCGRAMSAPAGLILNTPVRLAAAVERLGLAVQPLFLEMGAEPVPRLLDGPPLLRNYFDWKRLIAPPVTPPAVYARGVAAAIHYLAHERPDVLRNLPISLPHLVIEREELRQGMTRLLDGCGNPPPPEGGVCAAD